MNSKAKAAKTILDRLAFHETSDAMRRAAGIVEEQLKAEPIRTVKLWFTRFSTAKEVRCVIDNMSVHDSSVYVTLLPEADPVTVKTYRTVIQPAKLTINFALRSSVYSSRERKSIVTMHSPAESIVNANNVLKAAKLQIKNQGWKYEPERNLEVLADLLAYAPSFKEAYEAKMTAAREQCMAEVQANTEAALNVKVADLIELAMTYTPEKAHAWFTANGFENVPPVTNFQTIPADADDERKAYLAGFYIAGGWEMERKPDGYGHECGWAYGIDWKARKFTSYGWSSDD